MLTDTDVAVVGGGIVGTAAAFHLAKQGVETVLIDADLPGQATQAGAGIVSPSTSSLRADEDWFAFATEAAAYYPELVQQLQARGVTDHSYRERELLSAAVDAADLSTFEDDLSRIDRRTDEGSPSDARIDEIAPDTAQEAFPPLADAERVFRVRDAGQVDGAQFTRGLRQAAQQEGLSTVEGFVEEIQVDDGAVSGLVVAPERDDADQQGTVGERQQLDADRVVVAGGAWSAGFGDDLGLELPVEPIRGQIIHLENAGQSDADVGDWPIVVGYQENYIVPWGSDRVVVGVTREEGTGFDPRATAGGVADILDGGLGLAPGLADATLAEIRVGLRPGSPDSLPMLGTVPDVEGAFVATGHGPTGLMLGPYSGKVVAALARGETPAVDISAFALDRF